MHPFVADMIVTSTSVSSVHAIIDAASGRKLFTMNHLHDQFIDREVAINIPPNWEKLWTTWCQLMKVMVSEYLNTLESSNNVASIL